MEALGGEEHHGAFVGFKDFGTSMTLHGFNMDVVVAIVIKDEHVGIAGTGSAKEVASL